VHYDTFFDTQVRLLLREKSEHYEPTLRGLQKALGLDGETFHKYRSGKTPPPSVVLDHMIALAVGDPDQLPRSDYWDFVAHFEVKPVFVRNNDTEELEDALQIVFEGHLFCVPRFPIRQFSKFRRFIYDRTGKLIGAVKAPIWKRIVDAAMQGGYHGAKAQGVLAPL